ncbi:DEAD/DEAH box helicase [Nannocystis sp. ILAH1]|uniref:DEAD/DEAH box helicase n=1 Tax=Nannocystis sp. ILAH1 TaxID=2996789 RepID=UPI00226D8174|nr:DEAD/DEAH box helicase [Nannocystis sp. ILAH1]MCY0985571.1 DEAD/DEAH box helicase [Nannocystis sp. ILAH1]
MSQNPSSGDQPDRAPIASPSAEDAGSDASPAQAAEQSPPPSDSVPPQISNPAAEAAADEAPAPAEAVAPSIAADAPDALEAAVADATGDAPSEATAIAADEAAPDAPVVADAAAEAIAAEETPAAADAPVDQAPVAADAPVDEAVAAESAPAIDAPVEAVAEPEPPKLPESFDELELPDALRRAIARMGWTRPTPVQALSFPPLHAGHDVLVQSHTGSGKTGAFCMPWLAGRFDPRPAQQTGVQLLVLLPTRELAKQVCDELRRLAVETPVEVLPIYGGTPMQPQLAALKAGVHAVVGTPGRVLDHIRRRSLDLSKVATVVLDECDEMLSMGFLEDIRAILDACTGKHLTALFSATIPSDIQRIAKRYMKSPVEVQLSGDQVAAAEIDHAYYIVSGAIKTRDLLDVIVVEEPARAIVFCNTREETKLVASVLRREGYQAEELSSDLTQAAREKVMGMMREHKLRFLVATDVAARGIDISHVSHVINYSFPEAAEVYIHRTGRTGRAGRTGTAISLIHARELGNFYYLKLQYDTIVFRERFLPPADQLAAQRMEVKLDGISKRFPELVSPEWVLLARNLMADPRGERVIGLLLERAMKQPPPQAQVEDGERPAAEAAPVDGEAPRADLSPRTYESRDGEERPAGRPEYRERRDRDDRFGRRDRDDRRDRRDRRPERDERFGRRRDEERLRRDDERPRLDEQQPRGDEERRADERPREEERPRREDERPRRADERSHDERPRRDDDRPRRADERSHDERPRRDDDRPRRDDDRPRRADDDRPRRDDDRPRRADDDRPRRDDDRPRRDDDRRPRRDDDRRPRRDDDRRSRRDDDRRPRRDDDRRSRRDDDRRPRRDAEAPLAPAAEVASAEAATAVQGAAPVAAPSVDLVQSTGETGRWIPFGLRGRRGDRGRFVQWPHIQPGVRAAVPGGVELDATSQPAPVPADMVATPGGAGDLIGTATPGQSFDEASERRKRRRKRRRRRGGPGEETAPVSEAGGVVGEDEGDDESGEAEASAGEAGPEARNDDLALAPGGRKRRRKRRGRPGLEGPRPAAPPVVAAPEPLPPPAPRRPSQEEIVIDIDEAELEVVTSEFGELDNIDEFALLDRRQAVIETLQEEGEVELEDVSRRDAEVESAEVETEEDDETESESDTEAETETDADADADAEVAAGPTAEPGETDADAKKRRRRRRRKKAAPAAPPELTAPPHKDFWEVWSSKYSARDFDDSKFGATNVEPEPVAPPPAPVAAPVAAAPSPAPTRPPRQHTPVSAPARPAASATADADDREYTKVQLNLGRVHGHKSSSIRNLLRDYLGLEGRSIRDLTVRDASTLFRIHDSEIERCHSVLTAVVVDGIGLALERAENTREDLRAPLPEDFEDAPRGEATEIRLDPLEFESVLPLAEEPGT